MTLMARQIGLAATPVLFTDRLVLRAPEAGDLPGFTAFKASPRARFAGGSCGADSAFESFAMVTGHWVMRGHGLFTITLRDGTPIGLAGTLNPPAWPEPELAWNLWSSAHEGQGYAHEAVCAVRDHAFTTLGWTTAISMIAVDNLRSAALALRLGALPGPETELFGERLVIWRHAAPAARTQGSL